ncbi:MAG: phosphatase PAP2 family protein [Hydrogenimonas sp.]|nr:phosphatase PAP2 family protein [Hydrogenimonas sp.]
MISVALLGSYVYGAGVFEYFSDIDTTFADRFSNYRSENLTTLFFWITLLGKPQSLAIFGVAVTIVLLRYRKFAELIAFYISFLGSSLTVYSLKTIFERARPEGALYLERSYSFPSAHAAVAISFYLFLVYLCIRESQNRIFNISLAIGGVTLALLIGISRIYLGVHYLSDVVVGYIVGLICALSAAALLKRYCSTYSCPLQQSSSKSIFIDFFIAVFAVLLFLLYGFFGGFIPPK